MAIGDNGDILARLKSVLPAWWGQVTPILDGVLSGFAQIGSWGYGLLIYTTAQTRIATATDGFLDIASLDFFGPRVRRKPSQPDFALRKIIRAEVLRPRNTRAAMLKALKDLTGSSAVIFEPAYAFDTGGIGTYGFAFSTAGGFGSRALPNQMFIRVVQPIGAGVPTVAGFNTTYAGFGNGYFCLIDKNAITGAVTNQDIYDTVEATRAAGVTCWVNIGTPLPPITRLGIDFKIGTSALGTVSPLSGIKVAPEPSI